MQICAIIFITDECQDQLGRRIEETGKMVFRKVDLEVTGILGTLILVGLVLLPSLLPDPTIEDGEIYNLSYEIVSKKGEIFDTPETGKVYRLQWAEKRGEDFHCHTALEEIGEYDMEIRPSSMLGFEEESMQSLVIWGNDEVTPLRVFDSKFICPEQ